MKSTNPKADVTRKREEARRQADDHREEIVLEGIEAEEGAAKMGQDAVREMTEGQDHRIEDDEGSLEETADGPLSVTDETEEIARSESEPDDAEPAPFPTAMGEGP